MRAHDKVLRVDRSSGDTISNSEKLSMVSPELLRTMVSPELLHAEPAQLVPVVAGRRVLNLDKSGTRFFKSASIALPNSSHQPVLGMTL